MCIRDSTSSELIALSVKQAGQGTSLSEDVSARLSDIDGRCLLYTSDAADERSSVDLGGRRIIKKKKLRVKW